MVPVKGEAQDAIDIFKNNSTHGRRWRNRHWIAPAAKIEIKYVRFGKEKPFSLIEEITKFGPNCCFLIHLHILK
jgi:hypothetical protein